MAKKTNIVIISGACCIPGMAPLDARARKIVEQAVSETGADASIEMVPATSALMGGAPKGLVAKLMSDFNQKGVVGLPAVLIDGKVASFGVPTLDAIKSALGRGK